MSLIISTGSNLGDSIALLTQAKNALSEKFKLIAESRIYYSKAVDYEDQPDFYNQVLEFELPALSPFIVMEEILVLERKMGRTRNVPRGPRTIDIDIIFWGTQQIDSNHVVVPHPRWSERSFIVYPLQELPFFQTVKKCFTIPESFRVSASPI